VNNRGGEVLAILESKIDEYNGVHEYEKQDLERLFNQYITM